MLSIGVGKIGGKISRVFSTEDSFCDVTRFQHENILPAKYYYSKLLNETNGTQRVRTTTHP